VDEVLRTDTASYHVVQVAPGGREHPHRHVEHDLTVHVLAGGAVLHLGAQTLALRPGDVVLVPRDTVHWVAGTGTVPSVALAVFTPPLAAPDFVPVAVDATAVGG
jgi:quercetin dioxygenase-like cupin family protein